MRLEEKEIEIIRSAVANVDAGGVVYLFGSRVDDTRRGGDIDLFVEASRPVDLKQRLLLEYQISSECDTKIDLQVKSPGDEDSPIHRIARKGIRL